MSGEDEGPEFIAPDITPAPGWYDDPTSRHELRYWDGRRWTSSVSTNGAASVEGGPGAPSRRTEFDVMPDPRIELPPVVTLIAAGGIAAAFVLAYVGRAIARHFDAGDVGTILVSQAGLWVGLLSTIAYCSHRYGTGSIRADFQVRGEWRDAPRGAFASILARVAAGLAVTPFIASDTQHFVRRATPFEGPEVSTGVIATFAVLAVVGAPIVEELFFRGVLQRALTSWRGQTFAVVTQSIAFGLVHMKALYGYGNAPLAAGIGASGAILGIVYERYRRLAPSMVAHSCFNAFAVVVIVLTR